MTEGKDYARQAIVLMATINRLQQGKVEKQWNIAVPFADQEGMINAIEDEFYNMGFSKINDYVPLNQKEFRWIYSVLTPEDFADEYAEEINDPSSNFPFQVFFHSDDLTAIKAHVAKRVGELGIDPAQEGPEKPGGDIAPNASHQDAAADPPGGRQNPGHRK